MVTAKGPLAVLVSGGLDSAILVGNAIREFAAVHPLYVRQGLYWESVELQHLRRFLRAIRAPTLCLRSVPGAAVLRRRSPRDPPRPLGRPHHRAGQRRRGPRRAR